MLPNRLQSAIRTFLMLPEKLPAKRWEKANGRGAPSVRATVGHVVRPGGDLRSADLPRGLDVASLPVERIAARERGADGCGGEPETGRERLQQIFLARGGAAPTE